MVAARKLLRRLRLRQLLFLLLLASGIVPLAVSSLMLLQQNREILETQEKSYLTGSARFLSVELDSFLASIRSELDQLGAALLAAPPAGSADAKLKAGWVPGHLQEFLTRRPEMMALRVLQQDGVGPSLAPAQMEPEVEEALREAFAVALESDSTVYRFVLPAATDQALTVVAVPVGEDAEQLVVETVTRVRPLEEFFQQQAQGSVSVFLVDSDGGMLWFQGDDPALEEAVVASRSVAELVRSPVTMTQEYELVTAAGSERMLGHVSPVDESGWGVVVQRPVAAAFTAVRVMVVRTGISTAVLIAVALLIAALAARRVGQPIQQLAESTHEIAAGNFGERVEAVGIGRELVELGQDFNRMSGHVQSYVGQLEQAAQANRELFIGSMRAFTAAIDAKDPYTKGHSERVAAYSRVISKFLDLSAELEHRVWVGALMHDVGKIGIEDRILKKGGVLTDDEYEVMKLHPAIGAEIMSRIEQLKEMLPAIRWHHEAWNGKGYPDGLRGESIPTLSMRSLPIGPTSAPSSRHSRSRRSLVWRARDSTPRSSPPSCAPSRPARSRFFNAGRRRPVVQSRRRSRGKGRHRPTSPCRSTAS
jgi:HAMP domain-containing protein